MTDMAMDSREVLRRAADYIDEYGWHRGGFGNVRGPVCALGAINCVMGRDTGITSAVGFPSDGAAAEAVVRLADHLGLNPPFKDAFGYGNQVADWNDDSRMTASEVTAAMRAAADAGL